MNVAASLFLWIPTDGHAPSIYTLPGAEARNINISKYNGNVSLIIDQQMYHTISLCIYVYTRVYNEYPYAHIFLPVPTQCRPECSYVYI